MNKRKRGRGMLEARGVIRPLPSENGVFTFRDDDRARGKRSFPFSKPSQSLFVCQESFPIIFLVECATGYALVHAHGIHDIDIQNFQPVEDYINRSDTPFELKSYLPFSSPNDALLQFNAISTINGHVSTVPDKLMNFLKNEFKPPFHRHVLATADPLMASYVSYKLMLSNRGNFIIRTAMRGLREKIDKLIGLPPGELDKAQHNLARLYNNQMRAKLDTKTPVPVSSSSFLQEQVTVVPHRFEGFFNAKGKEEDILCTRNLVLGEALNGEKLIRVQNEDGTEVEYRVCDPRRSKLGAAILGGVTNIWIKFGSRVIYVGVENVCGLTVSDLSDLVGLHDGLVYVVGFSDDVAHIAGKRSNVVTIIEKSFACPRYRMLLSTVDVIFGDIFHLPNKFSSEAVFTEAHVVFYLKVGGHYMICTEANKNIGHDFFSCRDRLRQYKLIQTVMLDLVEGEYALNIGGYKMPG